MEDKYQEKPKEGVKISKKDFVLMLAVAIFFDVTLGLIQLIPIAGSVAASVFNAIPFTGFFIWYQLLGLDFKKPKRALTFFGCSIVEFIPALNALPGWTFEVVVMYIMQKKDFILAKAAGVVGGVAGATAIAGTGAKMIGAKNLGNNLQATAEKLKETKENIRGNISPLQNVKTQTVGNEVRSPIAQNKDVPNNIISMPSSVNKNVNNISQLPSQNNDIPHNEDWVFPRDKAA